MAKQTLAKLTRPKQSGVLARERLFQLLDGARECPLIWVSGPPGAGKTTALASYIEQRKLPCTWYQLDAADEDPANLFGTLRECAPKRSALPAFTEELNANLAAFTRRFFRQLFARLPSAFVLVLDGAPNLQEHATLAAIILEAAHEVPAGSNLVVISRDAAPASFARLHLQRAMARLGWEELRLQPDEALAIAQSSLGAQTHDLSQLHEQCGGWVAGLRLLLEHYQHAGGWRAPPAANERGALFGFFAAELFDRMPQAMQHALLRTSVLPEVTQRGASTLTREAGAWASLLELHERRLFVDALSGEPPTLRYHALFRDFLLAKARATLSAFEFKALQREAANLLAAEGRVEVAVPLLTAAGDWSSAGRLILEEASQMLAKGRTQTLREWVAALPSWYVDATPRLLYCLGLAQSTSDAAAALTALERAFERFHAQRNALGQALCAAAIIQTYYFRFDDYTGMQRWAHALDELFAERLSFPSAHTELHAASMLQIALTYVEPTHPRLPALAERVLELISRGLDVNQTIAAAALLVPYLDWFAPDKAKLLVGYVQALLRSAELTAFNHVWWLMAEMHHCNCAGYQERSRALVARIEALAEQHALRFSETVSITLRLYVGTAGGDGRSLSADIARATRSLNPSRRQEELNLRTFAVEICLHQDERAAGLAHAERALQLCRETGLKPTEMEALGLLSVALSECGHGPEALQAVRAARGMCGAHQPPKLALHHLLIEAYAELLCGNIARTHDLLRPAFAIAREQGYVMGYQHLPHVMTRLCAEALGAGIEVGYVREIIRARDLPPPEGMHSEAWPWPVKIYALGRFEIHLNSAALQFTGKTQKKPLDLLKALIARGRAGIEQGALAAQLWPDSDGDAADSALRMALHRLRKLLGNDDAVLAQEGKLQLNPASCWVDAWAFEHASSALEGKTPDQPDAPAVFGAPAPALQALKLYRGEAFATESLQPWMLAARDRWRAKFLRVVRSAGAAHEASADWGAAFDVYQSGIDADPLCEEFYQAQIACCLKQGKSAEAYAAYRRCREVLSITLGVKPTAKTESLRQKIALQGAA